MLKVGLIYDVVLPVALPFRGPFVAQQPTHTVSRLTITIQF